MESAGRLQPLPASAQEAVAFNTRSSGPVAVPSGRQATPGNQVRPPAANMVATHQDPGAYDAQLDDPLSNARQPAEPGCLGAMFGGAPDKTYVNLEGVDPMGPMLPGTTGPL